MTHEIHLRDEFGLRLSDGSEACRFQVLVQSAVGLGIIKHAERVASSC